MFVDPGLVVVGVSGNVNSEEVGDGAGGVPVAER